MAQFSTGGDSDGPVFWLDGLDIPVVQFLDASFAEGLGQDQQPISRPDCRATIWTTWSATISATANGCVTLDWGDGRQARSRLGGGLKGQALRPSPQSRHLKTVAT